MKVIARIHTDFPTKFGIPRQSGLTDSEAVIVFEPEYRQEECLRGIEEYSHLWLIWEFSAVKDKPWSPTVRPPRLGGNKRVGVFATRSPFRPNPIGLSSVKLICKEKTSQGTVLRVTGADLMDNTPIYDIKPYIPYADCHPEAKGSFGQENKDYAVSVNCSQEFLDIIPENKREVLLQVLSQDPRPSYIDDPERVYGFEYAGCEIRFRVSDSVLTVTDINISSKE